MGFLICFALLFSISSQAQMANDKQTLHELASEEFLSTHFFENGRGMTISPDLSIFFRGLNKPKFSLFIDPIVKKRHGFILGKKQRFMGIFEVKYKNTRLAVLGCTGCHSGRAAGKTIPGLGNKTIDPFQIGSDILRIQKTWGRIIKHKLNNDPDYKRIHEKAMNFAKVIGDPRISNQTRGLVPDAVIRTFFYKDKGIPYDPTIARTQVKVPSLWGIKDKRPVGIFSDGSLSSTNYAWAFGAELMASDSADHLRASLPKLKHVVDNVLGNLLPPEYPFATDSNLVIKGKPLVEKNCFGCHGNHSRDAEGFPVYEAPKLIPHNLVNTDPQRLDYGNSDWVDYAETGSLSDLIFFNKEKFGFGYFAPKLWGIWSRFPYFHNGSVPSLYHILTPPKERPLVFYMQDAGEDYRFDRKFVGLTTETPGTWSYKRSLRKAKKSNRNFYYVKREEHSNQGHYFEFMKNFSEDDKFAIIEYLKTL